MKSEMKNLANLRAASATAGRRAAAALFAACLSASAAGFALAQDSTPGNLVVEERNTIELSSLDGAQVAKASPTPPPVARSGNAAAETVEHAARKEGPIPSPSVSAPAEAADAGGDVAMTKGNSREHFHWKPAVEQALLFLGVQHGYALTQPKTRRDLHGPFFRDYFRSVKSLSKWDDGGRFFTNYVAHPMQGALLANVFVQNDPRGRAARFGRSPTYWRSRLKAVAWTAAWSTQFEIGPVSQASIGNVGLHGKQTWVDIVMTPVGGAAWLVAEDALERFVVRRLEAKTGNRVVRVAARMLLNPTRSSANLLRFKTPWHRDR